MSRLGIRSFKIPCLPIIKQNGQNFELDRPLEKGKNKKLKK